MTEQGHPAAERQLARIRALTFEAFEGAEYDVLLNEDIFSREEWASIVTDRAFALFNPQTAKDEPQRRSRRRYLGYYPDNRAKVTIPHETAYLNFWRNVESKFPRRSYDSYQNLDSMLVDDALTSAYTFNYIGETYVEESVPQRRDSLTSLVEGMDRREVRPYGIEYSYKEVMPTEIGEWYEERIAHRGVARRPWQNNNRYLEERIADLRRRHGVSYDRAETFVYDRSDAQYEQDYNSPWLRE